MTGRAGRERRGILVEPTTVVIRRPRHGWIAGLLGAGVKAVVVLVAATVALAVLGGVSAVLWWVGQARVPVLVLTYGFVAVAGCGFVLGRSGRLLTLARWSRLQGPDELAWPPGVGRVETGLVWEQGDPAVAGPTERSPGESRP